MVIWKRSRVACIKYLAVSLCISSGHSAVVFAQDTEAEAVRSFKAGQRAQDTGSFSVAAQEYLKVIKLMPQAAEAYASLGLVYNAQAKYGESEQALLKAEKIKPGLPGVSLYLGIDCIKQNQPGVAIRHLREALRLESANKKAWLWLSAALSEVGHNKEALEQLRKASLLFAFDPEVLLRLGEAYRAAADQEVEHVIENTSGQPLLHQVYGDIYRDNGLWQKAIGHYRRAISQDPQWHGARLGLGEVALKQGKTVDAEREFRLELESDPHSASAAARLAELALLKGAPEEAIASLDRAIHSSPVQAAYALGLPPSSRLEEDTNRERTEQLRESLVVLEGRPSGPGKSLALAFVNARLGNSDAFTSSWKDFQNAAPPSRPANSFERGVADFYRRDFDSAQTQLNAWLKVNPRDLQGSYLLARTYRHLSLVVMAELLAVAPDSYSAHQLVAETYETAENYEKAITEYKLVEKQAPELPGVHFAIGRLLLKTGFSDQAMDELEAELRINPVHAGANAQVGVILLKRNKPQEGMKYLQKAISLQPDLWEAHRELGEAYYTQKNYTMAEVEFQKVVEHDTDGSASFQLGLVYRALQRPDAAKMMFDRSREIKKDILSQKEMTLEIPEDSNR